MSKLVRVQLSPEGLPIRIFRNKDWRLLPEEEVAILTKQEAVGKIRQAVYHRSNSFCERCGRRITWDSLEMHETLPKGKGGEVSLENCEALCHQCHTGSPDSAHGDRRWQTAKINPRVPHE